MLAEFDIPPPMEEVPRPHTSFGLTSLHSSSLDEEAVEIVPDQSSAAEFSECVTSEKGK